MVTTRVLLADDHAVVAQALESLLQKKFDLVGVVHDGRAVVDAAEKLCPDVVITDLSMPGLNGVDAIREIRQRRPGTKVLVLTMHRDTQLAVDAFKAGASGYVLKVSPAEELYRAIEEVAEGRGYVTSLLAKDLITLLLEARNRTNDEPLTPRQRAVLQLIAEGRTMKEVASVLAISPRTAESHKYEIMKVLGLETTAALIQYAIRLKIVAD
jgi:DNA-binding NarL/FixJ family response regulator